MKSTQYGTTSDFRLALELYFGLPATIQPAANQTVVKAGNPLGGADRFLLDAMGKLSPVTDGTAQGLVLHQLDTDEDDNTGRTVMTQGVVNLNMLDSDVQALITDDVKKALPFITFIKR